MILLNKIFYLCFLSLSRHGLFSKIVVSCFCSCVEFFNLFLLILRSCYRCWATVEICLTHVGSSLNLVRNDCAVWPMYEMGNSLQVILHTPTPLKLFSNVSFWFRIVLIKYSFHLGRTTPILKWVTNGWSSSLKSCGGS